MRSRTPRYHRSHPHHLPFVGLLTGVCPHMLLEGLCAREILLAALVRALEIADLCVFHVSWVISFVVYSL